MNLEEHVYFMNDFGGGGTHQDAIQEAGFYYILPVNKKLVHLILTQVPWDFCD